MNFRDYLKSFLGSETLKAPPERHLDADSEAGLSASLATLVAGAKGWISTEEARRLFSPVHDPQYAFGELDSVGKENLESFARRIHCNPEILANGRVYFARKRKPFVGGQARAEAQLEASHAQSSSHRRLCHRNRRCHAG